MRTTRRSRGAGLLLALALIAGACGGDDAATTDDIDRTASGDEEVTITLARFFGDCDESTQGVTDVAEATDECEVIQILTNAFDA
jgi:multiple sugar transport system substrate-binding protein